MGRVIYSLSCNSNMSRKRVILAKKIVIKYMFNWQLKVRIIEGVII